MKSSEHINPTAVTPDEHEDHSDTKESNENHDKATKLSPESVQHNIKHKITQNQWSFKGTHSENQLVSEERKTRSGTLDKHKIAGERRGKKIGEKHEREEQKESGSKRRKKKNSVEHENQNVCIKSNGQISG